MLEWAAPASHTPAGSVAEQRASCTAMLVTKRRADLSSLAAAAREEKAGAEALVVGARARDSARDSQLARAGHNAEPEDALVAAANRCCCC